MYSTDTLLSEEFSTRDTANINHASNLRTAIEVLAGDPSPAEKRECLAQIEVSFHIMEHKALRIKELEAEIAKLKAPKLKVVVEHTTTELIGALAELEAKYERAQETIKILEDICLQSHLIISTGT